MDILDGIRLSELVATIVYTFLGFGLFLACFWILDKITHFSIQKELIEDQNIALAILMGAAAIALSIIIGNVIR
ncbi:MAG: DUF350 domain-containing protein [Geminicoccaceae bacterium]|nr:DUF350 domain-containing protein [Geminicoccaceae bacterium]MCB9944652.1 DUF350 domain-containing protein [Geminicoccaceae bacterium]